MFRLFQQFVRTNIDLHSLEILLRDMAQARGLLVPRDLSKFWFQPFEHRVKESRSSRTIVADREYVLVQPSFATSPNEGIN